MANKGRWNGSQWKLCLGDQHCLRIHHLQPKHGEMKRWSSPPCWQRALCSFPSLSLLFYKQFTSTSIFTEYFTSTQPGQFISRQTLRRTHGKHSQHFIWILHNCMLMCFLERCQHSERLQHWFEFLLKGKPEAMSRTSVNVLKVLKDNNYPCM